MAKLTAKQEGFVQDVFTGTTYAQSYRNNYDADGMADNVIWVKASELMSNGKVSVRLIELQEEAAERSQVTVESLTIEYEEARALGKSEGQSAAMSTATTGKAKLHGLLVDRSETKVEVEHDFVGAGKAFADVLAVRASRK